MGGDLRTWSLKSLEKAAQGPLLGAGQPTQALTTKSRAKSNKQLLRPVGRSLPDCCEAPAAALAPVVTAASVAERETAGCSSEEAAPPAERLPPTSFRLLGSSWTSGASEAESGRAGGELLGRTASASLLTPETWNLIGATQQKHHNKDAQLENHRQWCNQHWLAE